MANAPLAQEDPPAAEEAFIRDLADRLKTKIIKDNPTGIMRRDAHPKMHGVVKAEFVVEQDLPEALRVGIFKEPKTFPRGSDSRIRTAASVPTSPATFAVWPSS